MSVQPLHYSTQALTHFRMLSEKLAKRWPDYDQLEVLIANWLERAIVFQLPDNGQLFETRDWRPEVVELIRLPYPMIALEFTADATLFAEESGLTRADKRIVLAFSPQALPAADRAMLRRLTRTPFFDEAPADAIGMLALYAPNQPEDPLMAWGFAAGIMLWDPARDTPTESVDPERYDELPAWAKSRRETKHKLPVGVELFVERAMMLGLSVEAARDAAMNDSIDEIGAVWDCLSALNCQNVGTVRVPAPAALNKKRAKLGRALFKDTHFLDIAVVSETGGSRGSDGGHGSPRPHLRRGHLRRLPATDKRDALTLWINATHVRGVGTQQKPYRLRAGT